MKRILITGATGNVGFEVIKYLSLNNSGNEIIAGVRNIEKAKNTFTAFPSLKYVNFDFENIESFDQALQNIDTVFLLRPPHISNINKYFNPLIERLVECKIKQIVFLSVQGAEKSDIIPHNKIEKLIKESGISYIFLRPSYFMQNLTTTLLKDIRQKRSIVLPAGKAKFNWIDIENIGETAALLLEQFKDFENRAIELTGYENENFYFVTELISSIINDKIEFKNVNPLTFYFEKKKEGIPKGMVIVMIMLHFLPRFQKDPEITSFFESITGKKTTSLKEFIEREKHAFVKL